MAPANSSHSSRRRTAPLRLLLIARKHAATPTLAARVVPPLSKPTLVAENPVSFRISGDQGSSTACHPVRRSMKAFTRQPPFTPFPVPTPAPEPVPMMLKVTRQRRRPQLQPVHDGASGSGLCSVWELVICCVWEASLISTTVWALCCSWKWSRRLQLQPVFHAASGKGLDGNVVPHQKEGRRTGESCSKLAITFISRKLCAMSGRSFPAATQKTPATDVCSSGSYVVHYNVD